MSSSGSVNEARDCDRRIVMRTRGKKGNNDVEKMNVSGTSGVTIAPTAKLTDKRKSQELEICKMKLEWQRDKIDELTKERDYLKEQLAASLKKEATHSIQDSSEIQSLPSDSSESSDEGSDSSMSTASSDDDKKGKKKKGKAKKHKKSNKKDQKTRQRAQNPKQVVARYEKLLRLFRRGGTMSAAFKRLGVDRNTIVATAPIAELFIVAPDKYKELEKNKPKKLSLFATQCASAIHADPDIEDKFKTYKSSGKLLPLKTKIDVL